VLARVVNALVFLFIVGVGIAGGCVMSASEAIDEQLSEKKRHASNQTQGRQ